jgi:DNA-binding transcriptional MerR regulator
MVMDQKYSVKQLAKLAGISVRTLHLYDQLGLLKPADRTQARYRQYGEKELLRLQQILFYKELDFPLKQICRILDEPDFDILKALEGHKRSLRLKKEGINILLKTVDKTIITLKSKTMLNAEDLYDGLSAEQAATYRTEAIAAYGSEVVEKAEDHLKKMDEAKIKALVKRQKDIAHQLSLLEREDPEAPNVQRIWLPCIMQIHVCCGEPKPLLINRL